MFIKIPCEVKSLPHHTTCLSQRSTFKGWTEDNLKKQKRKREWFSLSLFSMWNRRPHPFAPWRFGEMIANRESTGQRWSPGVALDATLIGFFACMEQNFITVLSKGGQENNYLPEQGHSQSCKKAPLELIWLTLGANGFPKGTTLCLLALFSIELLSVPTAEFAHTL